MHPRDTNTAVCINMWAPGTPAKSYKTVYGLKVWRKTGLNFGPE